MHATVSTMATSTINTTSQNVPPLINSKNITKNNLEYSNKPSYANMNHNKVDNSVVYSSSSTRSRRISTPLSNSNPANTSMIYSSQTNNNEITNNRILNNSSSSANSPQCNNNSANNSPKPKSRSESRSKSGSFIKRLSLKFKSSQSSKNSQENLNSPMTPILKRNENISNYNSINTSNNNNVKHGLPPQSPRGNEKFFLPNKTSYREDSIVTKNTINYSNNTSSYSNNYNSDNSDNSDISKANVNNNNNDETNLISQNNEVEAYQEEPPNLNIESKTCFYFIFNFLLFLITQCLFYYFLIKWSMKTAIYYVI